MKGSTKIGSMLTAAAIKEKAVSIGFDLCGIAAAEGFHELAYLQEWVNKGYAGDMAWMTRTAETRADVRRVLAGARSVIVTGTLYNTDRPYSDDLAPEVARISRYAWGDDYHDVLKRRLDGLLAWMREQVDEPFDARAYVDTGPIQERVYAQYAGLGWIGKNTCLINPELGSWLFLGEIICTLPLEPDTQGLEQCGSCTRCLEACPTGALVEPGVLDSNRCLSYLTIELRSAIPAERRRALGSHVYGCDICQEVCPYNRPAPRSDAAEWQPRAGLDLPRLVDLWHRPDAELRRMTKGGPMTRARIAGLRRNIAVAIGNSADAEAIDSLDGDDLDRPSLADALVREHIDWALAQRPTNARRPMPKA
jgi:epoxyqueuosine reductase